jgi:putative hydrolase of the HAD superfamily
MVETDPGSLNRDFIRAFRAKSADSRADLESSKGPADEKLWWSDVVRQAFAGRMPADVFPRYFDEVFELFRTAKAWTLYPETRSTLEFLSRRFRLGIISNFDSRLFDLLGNLGIDLFFEVVTLSWKAGAAKPDARIFMHAVEQMNVPAANCLHIGDSVEEDFQGAVQAGLHAVLLDRRDRHPDLPIRRIENLSEIILLL